MYKLKIEKGIKEEHTLSFTGTPIKEFEKAADIFMENYEMVNYLECKNPFTIRLAKKEDRKCRFCGKDALSVSFKNDAHLVPELLGNKTLFSDFECDDCNLIFSRHENDLSYFLGITRSIGLVNSKNGVPKYKAPDKNLVIKSGVLPDKTLAVIIESQSENNDWTFDEKNNRVTINAQKHSYIPFNVFRSILKIALSVIPHSHVSDYNEALSLLISSNPKEILDNPFGKMNMYLHPGPAYTHPIVMLFQKREAKSAMPTHIFCLVFRNFTYQIYLPYNIKDKWMCNGIQKITFLQIPPFIDKEFAALYGIPKGEKINLNSIVLKKGEKQTLTMTYDTLNEKFPDSI